MTHQQNVLITGGSGLVGEELTARLLAEGFQVRHLSRQAKTRPDGVRVYQWDMRAKKVDPDAVQGVDSIIHLAGADIMETRWTAERKRELIDSRVDGLNILLQSARDQQQKIATLISSSAQGYYQPNTGRILNEKAPAADGYMGELGKAWEDAAHSWKAEGVRVVINRIGLVLAYPGSALEMMANPIKKKFGSTFGGGDHMYPWIHINDLVGMILHELNHPEMAGPYNAASPNAVSQKKMVKAIATALGVNAFVIPIPKFVMRLAMGERFGVLVDSFHLSAEKIQKSGYRFEFSDLDPALEDLLGT